MSDIYDKLSDYEIGSLILGTSAFWFMQNSQPGYEKNPEFPREAIDQKLAEFDAAHPVANYETSKERCLLAMWIGFKVAIFTQADPYVKLPREDGMEKYAKLARFIGGIGDHDEWDSSAVRHLPREEKLTVLRYIMHKSPHLSDRVAEIDAVAVHPGFPKAKPEQGTEPELGL